MTYAFDFKGAVRPAQFPLTSIDDAFDPLERMGVRIAYAKDDEIYGQEEDADLIYRVQKGAVRTTRLLSDGRRQIGAFYREGELFGFEPGAKHRFSAEALQDSVIMVLKRSALKAAGGDLDRLIWTATHRELERTQEHLLLLGRKNACEKVASFLLDLAGDEPGDVVTLPMGRLDMADYLGLTIETVSRMLSQLQVSHVIRFSTTRQFQVVNRAALARMAD
jgi:CRP/FNR family nitrogen fixation transcriptional regulator